MLEHHIADIDMVCNVNETVFMIFEPRDKSKKLPRSFPQFTLSGSLFQFVQTFKYLRHIITAVLSDDDDDRVARCHP